MHEGRRTKNSLATVLDFSQVAGGLAILTLAVGSAFINYHSIPALFEALDKAGSEITPAYWTSATLYLLFYLPSLLVLASIGLLTAIKGLRSLLIPDLPTSGSQPFRDYEEFRRGLQEHSLSCYRPLGAFVSAVFGERTMYLSPLRRAIVSRNGEKLKWRLLWIALAGLCILWVHNSVKDTAIPNYRLALPFVWLIVLQVVIAVADFLSCMLLVPQSEPRTDSHEALEFYKGFGHPAHLFSRLPDLGESLRLGEQPNRTYITKGEKATAAVSDVGEFGGVFYIERQPIPIDAGRQDSAYVLLAIGWLLRLIGCFLLLYQLLPAELRELAATGIAGPVLASSPLFVLLMTLASASAWWNGNRYYKQALGIIRSSQFKSVGILINVTGELSRADVRVGKAVTDSMESSNVAARSNFTARFWAAELVSEAASATAPRELLALNRTDDSLAWVHHFKQGIHQLRDERVTPVGIDFGSAEVDEITRANAALFADRARMLQAPPPPLMAAPMQALTEGSPSPRIEPTAAAASAEGEGSKECPECAEIVRLRAKKCRFCGYQFEPA